MLFRTDYSKISHLKEAWAWDFFGNVLSTCEVPRSILSAEPHEKQAFISQLLRVRHNLVGWFSPRVSQAFAGMVVISRADCGYRIYCSLPCVVVIGGCPYRSGLSTGCLCVLVKWLLATAWASDIWGPPNRRQRWHDFISEVTTNHYFCHRLLSPGPVLPHCEQGLRQHPEAAVFGDCSECWLPYRFWQCWSL